jgi:hypothetical protein
VNRWWLRSTRGGCAPSPRAHRTGVGAALALAALASAACAEGSGSEPELTLDQVRAATSKYRDVQAALADGYVRDPLDVCETPYHLGRTDEPGVMGIHYLNRELLGIDEDHTRLDVTGTHTDFSRPAALVYEPQADGSLELVAVENLVSADAWEAAGHRGPPSFNGQPYTFMADDPSMTLGAHYDLHLWLFRDNPDGVFAQYNTNATCQHHVFNMPMIHRPATQGSMNHE